MIEVGKPAIAFKLDAYKDGTFSEVSLSDYRGKWVFLCFYPGDFTFVWATEVAAVAARYAEFEALNTEVLAVSTDSIFVHKMWAEKEINSMAKKPQIPFPMLSDACAELGKAYNVYDANIKLNLRGSFIIDPDGNVQSIEILAAGVGRSLDEILRQIQAHQYVCESKGAKATPIGWTPGKDSIQPGPELVGKMSETWSLYD